MMSPKFSEKLAEEMAVKWAAQKIGPPLIFWGIGVLAWIYRNGFDEFVDLLKGYDNIKGFAVAFCGLVVLVITGALIEYLQLFAIRIAEGYWRGPFRILQNFRIKHICQRLDEIGEQADELEEEIKALNLFDTDIDIIALSHKQEKYARLDDIVFRYPKRAEDLMPTHMGNLLRAAELYPMERYGLNVMIWWPRLWLVIPVESRQEITEVRNRLNSDASIMILGCFLVIWTYWAWWSLTLSLVIICIAYRRMCDTASLYADLIRSVFDLYRFRLYEAMKWPLPENPAQEKAYGEKLTRYLFRGTAPDNIQFEKTGK